MTTFAPASGAGGAGGARVPAGVGAAAGSPPIRRVAMLSMHTSPLAQPGSGDAGGLNVYVDATARRLARRGVEVAVFTRATASAEPPVVAVEPGYTVRHVLAGPFDGVARADLPAQLCSFTAGVLRAATPEPRRRAAPFDVVHSHYWLSGQAGYLVRDRWGIPLVHSAHTLAKVKNAALAGDDDRREPRVREVGEEQVVAESDLLLAATDREASSLARLYGAEPDRIRIVHPGVDVQVFRPPPSVAARAADRALLGVGADEVLLVFAGRVQPHKGPAVLVRAAAELRRRHPSRVLRVLVVGDVSGEGHAEPARLRSLAVSLGAADAVTLLPARPPAALAAIFRAADVVAVPSYSESFGLVALEAQACGTPVVAARVGGLPVAVRDGRSGLLVDGHSAPDWADALASLAFDPARRARMAIAARAHAERFSWEVTVDALLAAYRVAAARSGGLSLVAGA